MKKIIGKMICYIFGHPIGGNVYFCGIETYCPRCGRKNLP
jgi:hypothetical protein